jgi:LPXTG-motif cell wall-anchored protein
MFTTLTTALTNGASRRTALVAAASIAGTFAVLGMPGLSSAAEQPAGPPTIPPIIVQPTVPPTPPPTVPPVIVNPTVPTTTIPDDLTNPTFPEPTNPDDLTNPTFPEPTNPDDLTSPDPGQGDPEGDPADPANPANPSDPADPASPAPQVAPQTVPTGQLPETGVEAGAMAVLAVALTAGGAAIVTLARRKAEAS